MERLQKALKIRPEEIRMVTLVVGLMFATSISASIGTPAADALFFTRFGVRFLPYMYIALGGITIVLAMLITVLLGTVPRHRLYAAIPLLLGTGLLVSRAVLQLELHLYYPVLWLQVSVTWTFQGLFTWGVAGAINNTRQAKRLYPLFGAGNILGLAAGGLATGPLVLLLGAENLLLVWAGGLVIAFLLGRTLLARGRPAREGPSVHLPARRRIHPLAEMWRSFLYVRQSELLRWLSLAALLFAVLLFSLNFPFSQAATDRFADADALSSFLGAFQGLSTALAFAASLFLANRLYARFGITNMVLVYTGIFLVGFLFLAFSTSFFNLVAFRFLQVFWYQGIAATAYQAVYNAVPAPNRDKTRAFIDGVPVQIGVMLAGVYLLLSQQVMSSQQLFLGAGIVAAAAMLFAYRASRAYRGALVNALREGRHPLFISEEEPFGGFQHDAAAVAVIVAGITDPDPIVRRVSAEILGSIPVADSRDVLVRALEDEDAQVRAALLRALAKSRAVPALLEILTCLADPEPFVRYEALLALKTLAGYSRGLVRQIAPLLEDTDDKVRASAAATLLSYAPHEMAAAVLVEMAASPAADTRAELLRAIANGGGSDTYDIAARLVEDPVSHVRRLAVRAVANTNPARCIELLVGRLSDADRSVREEAAGAVAQIGEPAVAITLRALEEPAKQEGALLSLERMPRRGRLPDLQRFIFAKKSSALHYHGLALSAERGRRNEPGELLCLAVRGKAGSEGLLALRAFGLVHDLPDVAIAIDHLQDVSAEGRATALEILDSVKGSESIKDLFPLWEAAPSSRPAEAGWLRALLEDQDLWLRACAVLVAVHERDPIYRSILADLAPNDPSALVREAAASVIKGDRTLDTLQTLSIMERIMFLRRVPLFGALAPADLKQIAAVARESLFSEGEFVVQQGESGDVMYIIVEGELSVQVDEPDGRAVEVARRGPGEYVGEMAIISHEPRMATLTATGEVRTLCLDRASFEGILRERPETGLNVMQELCTRLRAHAQ